MDKLEGIYENVRKIEFLLDTAIMNHLDVCSDELEIIITLIRDTNNASKNELTEMVYGE